MNRHPAWCARGHRCGLGEHRAEPVVLRDDVDSVTAVLTRIGTRHGREIAEIRFSVGLPSGEPVARRQLIRALAELHALIARLAR